jgi:SAM-dependent MidA family methyltransferase
VLGYTTQARFLINCGLLEKLERSALPERDGAKADHGA